MYLFYFPKKTLFCLLSFLSVYHQFIKLFKLSGVPVYKQTNTKSKWVCFVHVPWRCLSWSTAPLLALSARFVLNVLYSCSGVPPLSQSSALWETFLHSILLEEHIFSCVLGWLDERHSLGGLYRSEKSFLSFHTIFRVLIPRILVLNSLKLFGSVKTLNCFLCLPVGFFKLIAHWFLIYYMQSKNCLQSS